MNHAATTTFVRALGGVRIAAGGVMLAAPTLFARSLGVSKDTAEAAAWLTRMVGVREVALGLDAVRAAANDKDVRPTLLAQMASDAGDAAVLSHGSVTGRVAALPARAIAAVAAASVAVEAYVLLQGEPEPA